jgi:hypothetical protein
LILKRNTPQLAARVRRRRFTERTKAKGSISIRFAGLILHKMAKYLCEWL